LRKSTPNSSTHLMVPRLSAGELPLLPSPRFHLAPVLLLFSLDAAD
jgi:hypothetical protein